ncbi:hypothetical protein GCM10008949_46850 [Deinococcus humi]|nr:hypothetical protein GCM10008949_46850 [Deinococcus humi]
MMVEVSDPGMQAQEFLSTFPPFKPLLGSFLSSRRPVFLLNDVVAACSGHHLPVIDVGEARDFPNRGTVTAQLISADRVWNTVCAKQPGQEGSRRLGITMSLEQDIKHEAVLVHGPPQPMSDTVHRCADLV